ncbi:MAG: phage tail tape measure protein [Bacteroidetes bacterium]|nr:MAG: phage tail tape measure protein [Bacteroidota bacterium]
MAGSLGKLFVEIGADTSGLEKSLDGAEKQVNKFSNSVKKTGAAIGAGMSKAGKGLTTGVTLPLAAAGAGFVALSSKAANFENQMNEVFTLLPGISQTAMDAMSADVLAFSKEMGVLPSETVPALYQAISAGVPKENVFDFMTIASKASIAGVTELETTVDGITSVVNKYGSDVVSAREASDLMFTAVKLGKTNFEELSKSLFNVTPTAANLGVEFGTVTAALASMTAQGTPTTVATTQLRQMLVELSKQGTTTSETFKNVAGVGFKEYIAQGGNVQGALKLIEQAASDTGVGLQDMFGSVEAGNAALALTGKGAEGFANNIAAMAGSAGATEEAFTTMDKGASRSMEKLRAEFSATMIDIGNEFIPILKDDLLPVFRDDIAPLLKEVVVPAIKAVANAFSAMSPGMKKVTLVVVALVAALGPILMVLGPIISGITALAPILTAIGGVIGGVVLSPILLIVGAIAAVIAVLYVLEKKFGIITKVVGFVTDVFSDLVEWLSDAIPKAIDTTVNFVTGLGDKLLFVLGPIGAVVYAFKHWDEIITIISSVFRKVFDFIMNLDSEFKKAGWNLMISFAKGITSGVTGAIDAVKDAVGRVRNYLPGSDAKEGPLSDLTASGAALMGTFEKGIKSSSADPAAAFAVRAPQIPASGGGTATTYSSSVSMGDVHLSNDFDFEALMKQINTHQAQTRTQRGV